MKSNAIVCAIAAASLGFGSVSFAQGHGPDRDGRGPGHGPRAEHRDNRHGDRNFDRGDRRNDRDMRHFNARGPDFRRGGHIPREYRSRQYYVTDWRAHRLAPPPRGQQWVQVGSDYALIAIATGVIAQIILNN